MKRLLGFLIIAGVIGAMIFSALVNSGIAQGPVPGTDIQNVKIAYKKRRLVQKTDFLSI